MPRSSGASAEQVSRAARWVDLGASTAANACRSRLPRPRPGVARRRPPNDFAWPPPRPSPLNGGPPVRERGWGGAAPAKRERGGGPRDRTGRCSSKTCTAPSSSPRPLPVKTLRQGAWMKEAEEVRPDEVCRDLPMVQSSVMIRYLRLYDCTRTSLVKDETRTPTGVRRAACHLRRCRGRAFFDSAVYGTYGTAVVG